MITTTFQALNIIGSLILLTGGLHGSPIQQNEQRRLLTKLIDYLDSAGFNSIDLKFTAHCLGDNVGVLMDLSMTNFLASISIRILTINTKSLSTRGGKDGLTQPDRGSKTRNRDGRRPHHHTDE